jgi:ornithine cyclodeaminase
MEALVGEYMQLPLITADQVEAAFPLKSAMDSQRSAFAAFDQGRAVMGRRGVISNGNDVSFAYVARSSVMSPTIVKFGSITNGNSSIGLPVVQAYIAILDRQTGSLTSFIDGESVTRIRTTAASMVAAQVLANSPSIIAVVGAGLQGLAHARAAIELFSPSKLILVIRSLNPKIEEFKKEFGCCEITYRIEDAINEADLIFLSTNTVEPVLFTLPKPGTTVISIGSFSPNREEVAGEIVAACDAIFGDDAETIKTQSGSVIAALNIDPALDSSITSLGACINNPSLGRKNVEEIIMYFSVGLGFQDAAIVEKYFELTNK